MSNPENSEQPISNQDKDDEPHQEVFDFLERELGMPPLDAGQKHILGHAMADAIRALNVPHHSEASQYAKLQENQRCAEGMISAIRTLLNDEEARKRLEASNPSMALPELIELENALCDFALYVKHTIATVWQTPPATPAGGQEKGDSFSMYVFHLMHGWKRVYGKKATTSSSPLNTPPRFRGRSVEPGNRGGKFVYFAYVVQRFAGISVDQGQYGQAIRDILKELREVLEEIDVPNDGSYIAETTDEMETVIRVK